MAEFDTTLTLFFLSNDRLLCNVAISALIWYNSCLHGGRKQLSGTMRISLMLGLHVASIRTFDYCSSDYCSTCNGCNRLWYLSSVAYVYYDLLYCLFAEEPNGIVFNSIFYNESQRNDFDRASTACTWVCQIDLAGSNFPHFCQRDCIITCHFFVFLNRWRLLTIRRENKK